MADIIRVDSVTPEPPPPSIVEFAERLLRHETQEANPTTGLGAALQRICHALNARLSPLISSSGFQALFARALRLATRDFPFLATVQLSANGDCTLSGLSGALAARTSTEATAALIRRDFVAPNVLAVLAAARLDDGHDASQLTVNLDVPLQDDVIGHERDGMRAEAQLGVVVGAREGRISCRAVP